MGGCVGGARVSGICPRRRAAGRNRRATRRSSEQTGDVLHRHPSIPRRRPCEGHWRSEILQRIQHKWPRLRQRRHIQHRQGPNRGHRRERGVTRRWRDRCTYARKPAAHGEHRCRLQGRRCSGGFAVPAALRRRDPIQRPTDCAGRRRGVGDRSFRGVTGAGGI